MATLVKEFQTALKDHAAEYGVQLRRPEVDALARYYELLLKWNDRLHLVAPCSPHEFATRHVLESLLAVPYLSPSARVADVGSGGGLPIIPCLIARPDIRATLIESSEKKAVFLREALRKLQRQNQAQLVVGQFQQVPSPEAEFITCRALNRFQQLLPTLVEWSPPKSTLLLFVGGTLSNQLKEILPAARAQKIPGSDRRFLVIASRQSLAENSF